MQNINENIKMKCRDVEEMAFPERRVLLLILLRCFYEFRDEAFSGEDSATDKRLQVPNCPLHGEVTEVDFVQMR